MATPAFGGDLRLFADTRRANPQVFRKPGGSPALQFVGMSFNPRTGGNISHSDDAKIPSAASVKVNRTP